MGKKILAILLCIVLTGCTKSSQAMQERLDQEIATVSAIDWTLPFNRNIE